MNLIYLIILQQKNKMTKCITFGNWSHNYLYIILNVIFGILNQIIIGYGYLAYTLQLFTDSKYGEHIYIHRLFNYIIILIGASLFHLYEKKKEININKNPLSIKTGKTPLSLDLIYNEIYFYNNSDIANIFLIIFLYVLFEHIDIICRQFFSFADFWMMEILVMAYLNLKMFKILIYKHQLLSLCIVSIPFISKAATIVLFFLDENNHLKDDEINYKYSDDTNLLKFLYVAHGWLLPVAGILFFITMTIDSYIYIKIKKMIDLKFVSLTKILFIYGIFGSIFTLLISIITTFISCGKKNEKVYDIFDYICKAVDNDDNRFIESFKIYFDENVLKDLVISLFNAITNGFYILFLFKIIQNLTPVHKSFTLPLTFFFQKIILTYKINNDEPMKYIIQNFFLDLFSDFTDIISFLIYLEIIELNFCDLNTNLRKIIIKRGNSDSQGNNKRYGSEISLSSVDESMNELIEI